MKKFVIAISTEDDMAIFQSLVVAPDVFAAFFAHPKVQEWHKNTLDEDKEEISKQLNNPFECTNQQFEEAIFNYFNYAIAVLELPN